MTVDSQVKQSLASVKSIQSSISSLTARSQDKQAIEIFQQALPILDEIKNDLQQRVGQLEHEEEQYKGF
ncbi:DUF1657 domain-containing protein [Aquibacillus sediminis]|uniref:DUF1657 domain-containing protein n=1 Tax=Aquibacillus sediminis TaxID=2574734 RepID=UPI001107CD15|nr:DUF1657 domain-containing protein [Aquibacillus sediminis]